MKKIIISLSIIAVIASVAVGVTSAYFTDTETSENNTMAAGTMDLNVNGGDDAVTTMTLLNKAPGDSGTEPSSGNVILKNTGSLEGELDIVMGIVNNYACTDPSYGANDGTENCTTDAGTLGANAKMAPYLDINQDSDYDDGTDVGLKSDGSIYTSGSLDYGAINNYSGDIWNPVIATMAVNAEYNFVIAWEIPTGAGNEIQGDALDFDVTFVLEQANND